MTQQFIYNDGGRKNAGYRGSTGDCVTRAIAIASERPYKEVYDRLALGNATQRQSKYHKAKDKVKTASMGINVTRQWFKDYMKELGFTWVATMQIGSGCKVHLKADELPMGRLIVNVSKHMTTMIDGVIHDIYNPDRNGTRCVYGYFIKELV
jgi:hypothetical protein